MKSVVTGLVMLVGAMVRQKGHGLDDFGWRREVQQARETATADSADVSSVSPSAEGGGSATMVVAAQPAETVRGPSAVQMSVTSDEDAITPGDWDVACDRGEESRLVFDRASVRELGGAKLFRWAPVAGKAPRDEDAIYTALADCRAKSIEASWPGKRSETRAGTCGRHLVDSVCASRSTAKGQAFRPERERTVRRTPPAGGPSASATP